MHLAGAVRPLSMESRTGSGSVFLSKSPHHSWADLARPAADIKVRQAGSGAVVLEEEVSPIQSADAFHRRGSDLWISVHTFPGLSANDVLRATEIFSFIIYILYLILYISFRDKHPCIVEK